MTRVRIADRLFGAGVALLLQLALLLLLAQGVRVITATVAPQELTLILPKLLKPTLGQRPPAQGASRRPIVVAPSTAETPPAPPPSATPAPGALQGFGQSLFGCTPQDYGKLTAEERARCPGAAVPDARAQTPEEALMNPKSHSRDAKQWQEDLDERRFDASGCFSTTPALVVQCQIDAASAEHARADAVRHEIEQEKQKARAVKKAPLPNIPVRRGP